MVERLHQRDQHAMVEVYGQFRRLVYFVIYNSIGEHAVTEECSQETFWRIWNCIQSFDASKGNLEHWIATIAQNQARDHLRLCSSRAEKRLSLDDFPANEIFLAVPSHAHRIQSQHLILFALKILSPSQRRVIEWVYYEGRTLAEVAHILGRPLPTVKGTVRQALKVMGRQLRDCP